MKSQTNPLADSCWSAAGELMMIGSPKRQKLEMSCKLRGEKKASKFENDFREEVITRYL